MKHTQLFGLLALVFTFATSVALATESRPPDNRPPDNRPPQKQKQGQKQGQKQAQSQQQTATAASSSNSTSASSSTSSASLGDVSASGGNAASSADNALTIEAARNYKNTPDVSLGGLFPSAVCMGVVNAGVSGAGFGIGGGKSYVDHECDKRETARSFAQLGYTTEALVILCSTEAAQVLDSCPRVNVAPPAVACSTEAPSCPDPAKVEEQKKQILGTAK